MEQAPPETVVLLRVEVEWMLRMLSLLRHPLNHEVSAQIAKTVCNGIRPGYWIDRPPK
jgi:hypothetical protein